MAESTLAALFFLGLLFAANAFMAWAQKKTIDHKADSQQITIRFKS